MDGGKARIVLTALIGQWFGVRYAQGFFHAFSGWLIFVVAFAITRILLR